MNQIKNIAASVRARLLNISKKDKRPFGEFLQYYAMERFLYRLSLSKHSKCFILKGALMLRIWDFPAIRPTMDIDMLGITDNESQKLLNQIKDIIQVEVEPDGLLFNAESLQTEEITEDANYKGIRIRFQGALGKAKIRMQIDVGFGDALYPTPEQQELPTILDFPAPSLLCYTRESAIAEKFEAMVKLGEVNSRMKDFYDIWMLSRQFEFSGSSLREAIRQTFSNRETTIPESIEVFEESFADKKQMQWTAFRKRLKQDHIPEKFLDIIKTLKVFLEPVIKVIAVEGSFNKTWNIERFWGCN
jgi:hypothetical protein